MGAVPSRIPVPIGDRPPAAARPQFFGQIPEVVWRSRDLSDRAKVVLGALTILARGSRTWVQASLEEIAVAAGKSARVVSKGLAELVKAGVVLWESIGARFVVLFRLRGQDDSAPCEPPPAPRVYSEPAADPVPFFAPDPAPDPAPVCVPKRVSPHIEDRAHVDSPTIRDQDNVNVAFLRAEPCKPAVTPDAGSNVNVISTLEEKTESPQAEPESIDQIRARIADLQARYQALKGSPRAALRMQVFLDLAKARACLEALEGPATSPPAPCPPPVFVPPAKPAGPPSVQTLIGRLVKVAGPEPIETFAQTMATAFDDFGSIPFYRKLAGRIRSGEIDPKRVWEGYRRCRNREGGLQNRAAAFNAFVRRIE